MKKQKTYFLIKSKDKEKGEYLYFNKQKGFEYGDKNATAFKNVHRIEKVLPLIKETYNQMVNKNPEKYDIMEIDKFQITIKRTLFSKRNSIECTPFYYHQLYDNNEEE